MIPSKEVIRVLNGRLAGTEQDLEGRTRLSIGHEFWNDIVLREPDTRDIALEFSIDADGAARIDVLSGHVDLLGSKVDAGQHAILPPFVPLKLGGYAIAWGARASARWADVGTLLHARDRATMPAAIDGPAEMDLMQDVRRSFRRWFTGWRPVMLAGAGLLIAAAPAAGPAVQSLAFGSDPVERAETALQRAGLNGLQVHGDARAGEGLVVTGVVPQETDRLRVQKTLYDKGLPGTVDVQTSADLAAAAADVARLQGHRATARPVALAAVELRTAPLAEGERSALEQAVKTDVAGIDDVTIRDDLPPGDSDAPVRNVDDVTKRVATVVAGDPAYIQTVDGAYYFPGAVMPTGHRLVSVEGHNVLLEKNGRQLRLSF